MYVRILILIRGHLHTRVLYVYICAYHGNVGFWIVFIFFIRISYVGGAFSLSSLLASAGTAWAKCTQTQTLFCSKKKNKKMTRIQNRKSEPDSPSPSRASYCIQGSCLLTLLLPFSPLFSSFFFFSLSLLLL